MMFRLDGTETIADLRETMGFLSDLKKSGSVTIARSVKSTTR